MIRFNVWIAAILMIGLTHLPGWAQNYWTTNKLNGLAVAVLGTDTNVWTAGMTREAVFDGSTNTYFDTYAESNAWAGIQLSSAKSVTRLRYCGYTGRETRLLGARFEGATTADFSDAVTLWTHTPPSGWTGNTWIDITLTNAFQRSAYTYLRFIATAINSYGGSVREVEFYGVDPITNAPAIPSLSFGDSANWYTHLRWTVVSNAMAYEIQRKFADEATFSPIATNLYLAAGFYTWRDPKILSRDAQYRLRAWSPAGASEWTNFSASARNAATGTFFGVAGSYMNNNMIHSRLYDANIETFFDGPESSNGNNLWGAMDLGQPRTLTGLRFIPRREFPSRMTGGKFQAAANTNFTDAVTLYTIPADPPIATTTEVVLNTPVTFRYVRYLSPNGGWGNAAEIEFDVLPLPPVNLSATSSDITNDFPVITWSLSDYAANITSCKVYRATSPGGPYAAQGMTASAARLFTDTNVQVGVAYYYKVSNLCTNNSGTVYEGALSTALTWYRAQRIERDWSNQTVVKSGLTIFQFGTNYGNSASVGANKVFDGSLSSFADILPSACSLGIDFVKPHAVKFMRFSPRSTYVGRVNGAVLRGSDTTNNLAVTAITLATFTNGAASVYTINATTNTTPYRYIFATRLDGAEFYGNIAELELYGWPTDAATNILQATSSIILTAQANGALAIAWTASSNAASYRVERALDDGYNAWTTVGTTTATNLIDSAVSTHVRYLYRVASLRTTEAGEEVAYSESAWGFAYIGGAGVGLTGTYRVNYTKEYRADETIAAIATNGAIDFAWASGVPLIPAAANSSSNVMISWTGKLIVPVEGSYTFYVTSDDGCSLRIDDQFLINDWTQRSAISANTMMLTAGEHEIRFDYYQVVGSAVVKLEWAGPVMRAVIPSTQLIPGDVATEQFGAWKGRTFNTPKLGAQVYSTSNDAITVYSAGVDLSGPIDGHHLVWQQIGGSFQFEAKVFQLVNTNATSAKALLMARNTLATGSPLIAPARMATGQLGVKARRVLNGTIDDMMTPAWQYAPANPCWMRLTRRGNTFTGQFKNTSTNEWTTFYTFIDTNAIFTSSMIVGLSVTSPNAPSNTPFPNATFSDIRLFRLTGSILLLK